MSFCFPFLLFLLFPFFPLFLPYFLKDTFIWLSFLFFVNIKGKKLTPLLKSIQRGTGGDFCNCCHWFKFFRNPATQGIKNNTPIMFITNFGLKTSVFKVKPFFKSFTAKLRGRSRDFPYTPCLPPSPTS